MIRKILNWLHGFYVPTREYNDLDAEYNQLYILKQSAEQKRDEWFEKYADLKEEVDEVTGYKRLIKLEKEMRDKYPPAKITYKGRSLPFSKKIISFPVNCLLTPYDPYIISDLIDWNMYQTGEDPETLIPKIYKKVQSKYYNYDSDINTWGTDEIWELPFESRYKLKKGKGVDCDSWLMIQMSYYLAAGVPYMFVQGVAGHTGSFGHATVYVYSLEDNKFHHLNSTTSSRNIRHKKISDFPTHQDALSGKDKIGINKVWFSWNLKRCHYKFSDKKQIKELKKFNIEMLK